MSQSEDVLQYWFGTLNDDKDLPTDQAKLWFGKSADTDRFIKENFEADLERAAGGELEDWKQSARGSLAWIILLDQFSRNIYRESPKAFAQDPLALAASLTMQETGQDKTLRPLERVFVYLPMEHAEDLAMQDQSVAAYKELYDNCPEGLEIAYDSYHDYAHRHRDIIVRFGRYPHRNEILGRESTPEEIAFLKEKGSSF